MRWNLKDPTIAMVLARGYDQVLIDALHNPGVVYLPTKMTVVMLYVHFPLISRSGSAIPSTPIRLSHRCSQRVNEVRSFVTQ